MLVYFIYGLYYLPLRKKPPKFKGPVSGKIIQSYIIWYNISYQIKRGISSNIYQSVYLDNIAQVSYLFNVHLTITHFVFYRFGLVSKEKNEKNPPSKINMQLIH